MKLAFALALMALPLPAVAQTVAADTPGKTASGVAYTQPRDWNRTVNGPATVFSAPEGTLQIAVVEVGAATDARDAATKAWAGFKPDAGRIVRLVSPGAPAEGWDERVSLAYENAPSEQ